MRHSLTQIFISLVFVRADRPNYFLCVLTRQEWRIRGGRRRLPLSAPERPLSSQSGMALPPNQDVLAKPLPVAKFCASNAGGRHLATATGSLRDTKCHGEHSRGRPAERCCVSKRPLTSSYPALCMVIVTAPVSPKSLTGSCTRRAGTAVLGKAAP